MGLNFNRFSINSQRWKNAISTGNFYRVRICLILLQILQWRWQLEAKSLVVPATQELFLYVKYWTLYSTSKFDYHFFDTPCMVNNLGPRSVICQMANGFYNLTKCKSICISTKNLYQKINISSVVLTCSKWIQLHI